MSSYWPRPRRRLRLASWLRSGIVVAAVALGLLWVSGVRVARAQVDESGSGEAAELVLKQLAALRTLNFGAAYELASAEVRKHFTKAEFEWMVKRAHPELAGSSYAFVVRTHEADGFVYVTAKVRGKNGKDVEALYEVVREGDDLKVNAVTSRRDDGML